MYFLQNMRLLKQKGQQGSSQFETPVQRVVGAYKHYWVPWNTEIFAWRLLIDWFLSNKMHKRDKWTILTICFSD